MGQQIEHEEHDKFVISCVPLKTQARSMYALVNSESANVAVTPVVPSGKVKRPAEEEPAELPPVAFAPPTVVDGEPEELFASCAKPTAGGLERKTVYTFLRNVSPTIHSGVPGVGLTLEPAVISKMAPRQSPLLTGPRFRSARLIGHAGPPNDIAMLS